MSRTFYVVCLALLTGAAAYAVALFWLPASVIDGAYGPVGGDSFYHARRILDTVAAPGSFYEFDPKMHAPEGSWITWPWGYDLLVAWAVLALQQASGAADPMAILVYVSPTWAFVNASLLLAIGATLGLQLRWLALLGAAFALSPLTQWLHGLGAIDHHCVEYSFILGTILTGVRWLQAPHRAERAIALGIVVGAAPAFHNGMFALQIPVDAALLILWLKGQLPPAPAVRRFAAALLVTSLAILLPSEPFRVGQFSMATLSWFHLYVATLTAGGAWGLAALAFSRRNLAILAGLAAAALIPAVTEMLTGSRFLMATLVQLEGMGEALGFRQQVRRLGLHWVLSTYSAWIVLLPLIVAACVVAIVRRATPPAWLFAAVYGLFGAVLMSFQWRLHYFGSPVLFVAPFLALQYGLPRLKPSAASAASVVAVAVLAAGYLPTWSRLRTPPLPGWYYTNLYPLHYRHVYPVLRAACAEHPGIVLAGNEDGHYIRFHTECAVISNNFILTPIHEQKLLEKQHLMTLGAAELLEAAPHVDYVFVHQPGEQGRLIDELLHSEGPYPAGYELLTEVFVNTPEGPGVLAKVFRIRRGLDRPDPLAKAPAEGPESD